MNFLDNLGQEIEKEISNNKNKIERPNVSNENITDDEIELANKLDAVIEYTLDRFEGEFAVCEDRRTGEYINIEKDKLPESIKIGDIFKRINGKYFIDNEQTEEVTNRIKNKMDNLWE